eukprot:scaffold6124_cov122-Cylindrotheca_fusiformis.AAC.14
MPVYLCQPGTGTTDPWKHGIQVYATPFAMDEEWESSSGTGDTTVTTTAMTNPSDWESERNLNAHATSSQEGQGSSKNAQGVPIRRVRHSEVVLVDDVCVAFQRYWIRLRWPGSKGGFAGYIALGKTDESLWIKRDPGAQVPSIPEDDGAADDYIAIESSMPGEEDRITSEEVDIDDPTRDEEPQDNGSTQSSEPFESTSILTCLRTGLKFPSSVAMKLLPVYDDGLSPPVVSAPLPSEPVFCRICREGLHDDADDEQPSPAMENEGEDASPNFSSSDNTRDDTDPGEEEMEIPEAEPSLTKGPVQPYPTYHPNTHAAENPILAPCECAGSMAFVHYLCVEQWRCRSRHPEANHGLNCETCSTPYALPPPSARPANVLQVENEDWLEAMPPHVMAALRQPHIWWQIGAAVVRRRWLRPIAPIVMSPVVALYCRARRLLKKKGVARRRWACSLCRRRARWKCVRCLRSYYCSRQCQNVSWHIVHKHVCYKPSRWAWSVVLYGMMTLFLFPGILKDPLMYDLGLGFVPTAFYAMAILGGGFAAALKKSIGLDLRGRAFEVFVILSTFWLVVISWGLVGAFFGDSSRCHGVFGKYNVSSEDKPSILIRVLQKSILEPAASWFLMWDRLALNAGRWIRKALCTEQEEGCFENLHKANSDFFLEEYGGGACASDLSLVSTIFLSAGVVASCSHILKRRDRQRRAARRPRPHQD